MLRSRRQAFQHYQLQLPEFASWSVDHWQQVGDEGDEIRDCMLGWDVTDFGSQRFDEIGRVLFTLRNGRVNDSRYTKTHAGKLILDPEEQRAPAHYHRSKCEDIICRAGGNILVQLQTTTPSGDPSNDAFDVAVDGLRRRIQPSEIVRLRPGQSLCIPPRTIHQFWGEEGTGWRIGGIGYSVSGEVSSVCDDCNDNVFLGSATRFPDLIEDEPRRCYLSHEYPPSSAIR